MRKIIAVLLAVCCLTGALSSCSEHAVLSETEYYSVLREGEKFYLQFKEEMNNNHGFTVVRYPEFESAMDMKQSILSGEAKEYDLSWIELAKDENGRVELIDLNQLYDLRCPEDVTFKNVIWQGGKYYFTYSYRSINNVAAACSEEVCRLQYEKVTGRRKERTFDLRDHVYGGEFFGFRTDFGDETVRREYQITDGTKTRLVVEVYESEQETLPNVMWIFGRENGSCFFATVAVKPILSMYPDIKLEKPTEDWLLSFGLEKLSEHA